jgi:hypothetical protein
VNERRDIEAKGENPNKYWLEKEFIGYRSSW